MDPDAVDGDAAGLQGLERAADPPPGGLGTPGDLGGLGGLGGLGDRARRVLADLADLRRDDLPTRGGTTTAYVFDSGLDQVDAVALRAYELLAHVNGLDPTQFPSVARIENDLVSIVAGQLGGDHETVGTVTSGGTESCLLAVLGARELWRRRRSTGNPRIVVPATAHAAFFKAAHLFGLKVQTVPVDPDTLRADPEQMAAAIGPRTALVVASAPAYAYGVVDPVEPIAAAAAQWEVPCHVDACIGGWILPFLDDPPAFGLDVPGVTSIAVDLHKYGYVPKGVSVLLHRSAELRRLHWFTLAGWAGYPLVNPTLQSSRPVGPMASAWAVQKFLGIEDHDPGAGSSPGTGGAAMPGFRSLARSAHDAARRLAAGIDGTAGRPGIGGLRTVGDVDSTLVAFTDDGGPDDPDVRVVVDELAQRGWYLQVQPSMGTALRARRVPMTAHASITGAAAGRIDELLTALRDSADAARAHGRVEPDAQLVEMARTIEPAELTEEQVEGLLRLAGVGDGGHAGLPARMAPVHALVDAVPAPLAERLLAAVLSRQLTPPR
ncbi:pyridoxal phosphate-dependent decarboxylase family protein [Tomitella fengzijianii]|uniref:Aspartate aminotransferase family protein n=1 Tax=Tomitella fengzijianii TaxID=2597660 RepID=A0A516X6Y2_9ACTN|nr:aminotransferase class V-fold PLP-dependent enzyme [Tomitella fengzijianii]QDQ98832.1 aspartate aminotransferase family protein [Tomitella fengzijianii]